MVTTRDLQYYLFKLLGIRFGTCPVSGHSAHGQVERMIRTVQECLLEAGIDKVRLHATGVQTLCKLVESEINSIPLGYKHGRNANNSSVLKIITPNVLRMGRVNQVSAFQSHFHLLKYPYFLVEITLFKKPLSNRYKYS